MRSLTIKKKTYIEGAWKQGSEANMWTNKEDKTGGWRNFIEYSINLNSSNTVKSSQIKEDD
jgi:hypothetical protein